jgi:subtilisin-like proprotein convertase family protein
MSNRASAFLIALLVVPLSTVQANAQSYPCLASAGTECRSLIPDEGDAFGANPDVVPLVSTITVVPTGPCTGQLVSHVAVELSLIHDWRGDLGVTLSSPTLGPATLRSHAVLPGSDPLDDLQEFHVVAPLVGSPPGGAWTLRVSDYDNSGTGALDDWTLHLVCGAVPAVSIQASVPNASEAPVTSGTFQVTRSIVTADPLLVELTIGGTAGPADYAPLPLVVTIPANQASVTFDVTPVADGLPEGPETVIASIADPTLFTVGAPSSATVTINEQQQVLIPALGLGGLLVLAALLALLGALVVRSRLA